MNNIKLFHNGYIHTVEEDIPFANAMAVKGKTIIAIGEYEDVKNIINDIWAVEVQEIDLKNNFVMPGFMESHAHPTLAGPEMIFEVDLGKCTTVEGYVEIIKQFIVDNPDLETIMGAGWSLSLFDEIGPRKEMLDEISSEKPIILFSNDHHALWLNSKALDLANINSFTKNVEGGVIERDLVTKEPLGTIREEAAQLVEPITHKYSQEEYEQAWIHYQTEMAKYGITMVHDAKVELNSTGHKALAKLAKNDELLFKVTASIHTKIDDTEYVDEVIKEGKKFDCGMYQAFSVKFFIDGVVENGTAYLKEPYKNKPEDTGTKLWDDEKLFQTLLKLDNNNFWSHFHVIGDAATLQTIEALERVAKINGNKDRRNTFAHAQIIDKEDIKRIKDLQITVSSNPYWFAKEEFYDLIEVPFLGEERASKEYPMKSLLDENINLAAASDFPVTPEPNPLAGIRFGMQRALPEKADDLEKVLAPEERLTIHDMIKAFTINGAYMVGKEKITGSLKVGKDADFIVLNKNILEIDPKTLEDVKVIKTFAEGKEIFSM